MTEDNQQPLKQEACETMFIWRYKSLTLKFWEKSCESWFCSGTWVCGFFLFCFVPGIIFQVPPFTVTHNPSCAALKDTWYFSMSHSLLIVYIDVSIWAMTVVFRVKPMTALPLMLFPWCKSKKKYLLPFLLQSKMIDIDKILLCMGKNISKSALLIDNMTDVGTVWDSQVFYS